MLIYQGAYYGGAELKPNHGAKTVVIIGAVRCSKVMHERLM